MASFCMDSMLSVRDIINKSNELFTQSYIIDHNRLKGTKTKQKLSDNSMSRFFDYLRSLVDVYNV